MVRKSGETGEMLPLLLRHEIQVLRRAKHSQADVAARTGVSLATVRRVERETVVVHVDDRGERKTRQIGRPSKATKYTESVREWLADNPELPTQELLRRAQEAGYEGRKSAFYAVVAAVRPPRSSPVVRFEGLPGEFSQHDFGHVDVTFVDGTKKRVHFFASRLKYSRSVAVTLVENERVETLLRCVARHFVAFGGLPLMAVFDRPRTIVKKGGKGREVEQWNATFAQAMLDIGVSVEICAPRSGNQKGSVERLVGWVKGAFFKHRKFVDEADLLAQLEAWVLEVNTRTACRATGVIPETRRLEELPRLRPIKVIPEKLALRFPIFVGPTAEVMFEGVPYSMPPEATHVAGTLFLFEDRVKIVAGRYETVQRRRRKGERPDPVPEHRASKLAAVHGKRAKLYEKRQHVLNLGKPALLLLTEITHRNRKQAGRDVEQLYALLEQHGVEVLATAIERAVVRGHLSVQGVRRALQSSTRGREGNRPHVRAVQPRARESGQLELGLSRAPRSGGAS
ncbi:MAG: IS21 family transposase [Polyangiaceae bacterium]|nr:IS21 family transposase [Polyangiaceae bacterium]